MQTSKAGITRARALLTLANVLVVAFIFYNSSRAGQASAVFSQGAMELVNGALARMHIPIVLSHFAIRKLGHLAEFTLLGFWLLLLLRVYTHRLFAHISWPLLAGLFIACADEFIQQFVPGRSSSLSDVFLDFIGVAAGMLAALVCVWLAGALRRRKKRGQASAPPPAG